MPYLADRPVVLTRFPDGIEGKSFYQKDAPVFTPEWIRTEPIWHEDAGKENRFTVRYLAVYAKSGGAWRMVAWQSTRVPDA